MEMVQGLGFSQQVPCSFCKTSSLLACVCLTHHPKLDPKIQS